MFLEGMFKSYMYHQGCEVINRSFIYNCANGNWSFLGTGSIKYNALLIFLQSGEFRLWKVPQIKLPYPRELSFC